MAFQQVKQFSFFYTGKLVVIITVTVFILCNGEADCVVCTIYFQSTNIILVFFDIRILRNVFILTRRYIYTVFYKLRNCSHALQMLHILIIMLKDFIYAAIFTASLQLNLMSGIFVDV